jgi:CheY-like chemotaxis protein
MNRILIIEDDPIGATIVQKMCEEAGIRPREFKIVSDLEEGLRLAQEQAPDLILCDLVVPPVGEYDCITRFLPALSSIAPVGVWTGSVTADVVIKCHAAGAHFCLLKHALIGDTCKTARLAQAIGDAILNWRREHARR